MTAEHILAITQTCRDREAQVSWYKKNFGFVEECRHHLKGDWLTELYGAISPGEIERSILRLGDEQLHLCQWRGPSGLDAGEIISRPIPLDSQSNDLWFQHLCMVTSKLEFPRPDGSQNSIKTISTAVQILPPWNPGAAGIKAVKLTDPLGHALELLEFPADKGDPRWHQQIPGSSQPMGIDHSAIGVSDTQASLHFYRDLLGFQVKGGSFNHGPEQDGLDGLNGVQVEITSLRPADQALGIEFLNYQQPEGGRRRINPQVTDLCEWQIIVECSNLSQHYEAIQDSMWAERCGPLVALDPLFCGKARGFFVRDPDQHGLVVVGD